MRKAGTIDDPTLAERFGDYLLTIGIENRVDAPEDGSGVWIFDEGNLEQAKQELDEFLADPGSLKYRRARQADSLRRQEAKDQEIAKKHFIDVRTHWARRRGPASAPLTIAMMVVCVLVFLLTGGGTPTSQTQARVMQLLYFASGPGRGWEEILHGQVWRLISPIFMHGGLIHILFNMLWLNMLGRQIEARRGTLKFLGIVLVSAALSNAVQFEAGGFNFAGMSGVVYALLGYIWMQSRYGSARDLWIDRNTMVFMIGWLCLGFFGLFRMANGAHLGGLVSGALLGSGPFLRQKLRL